MSDENKKPLHPETNFLPPLKMVLAFLERNNQEKEIEQEVSDEEKVEKLIEKLSEKGE
jgi:hypothetical protein